MRTCFLFILVSLTGFAEVLPAQGPPSGNSSKGTASQNGETPNNAPRDAFIDKTRIAAAASKVEEDLRAIEEKAKVDRPTVRVDRELSDLATWIERRRSQLKDKVERRVDANDLETEIGDWETKKESLEEQQADLTEWTNQVDMWTGEIKGRLERWRNTFERYQIEPDEALRTSITETTEALRDRMEQLAEWSQESVELGLRTHQHLTSLKNSLAELETALGEARSRLLKRDADPWWQGWSTDAGLSGELELTRKAILETWNDLLEYGDLHREQVLLHLICFLLFAWVCRFSRARLRARNTAAMEASAREETEHLLLPVQRAWSAALLLGLFLTPFIHGGAARRLQLLVLLLLIPAWLRVLTALVAPALRVGIIALTLLVLLGITRAYLDASQLLDRLILIGELALAAMTLAWLRQTRALDRALEDHASARWLPALRRWQRLGLVAAALGLGAALLGYTNLGDVAARLVVAGIFLGTLLFAAIRVLGGVLEGLLDAPSLNRLHMVRTQKTLISRTIRRVLRLGAIVAWIYLLLVSVVLWGLLQENLARVLSAKIGYGEVSFSLWSLIVFVLTLWISWLVARTLSFLLNEEVFARTRLPAGVPETIASFTRYAVLVMGFLVAVAMVGLSLDRLALLLSALGVGIGFGLQNITNNFVSGLILLFERPVRVGDQVQLDEVMGRVVKIGIRASVVLTREGSEVLVPNGDFISGRVTNWTLRDRKRRVTLPVGVAYGTDPQQVLDLLLEIATAHRETLGFPGPEALFLGFGESSLDFELRAWTDSLRDWRLIRSELAVAANGALVEAGIEIPFPQRDLHVRSMDPDVQRSLEGSAPADDERDGRDGSYE